MKYLTAAAVFVVGELVGLIIFSALKWATKLPKASPARKASVVKGILERVVLFVGPLHGFPQVLIAFGALKIGTRLHEDKGSEISNSYFLVGNLISMLLAMLYTIITREFWGP
ncbi:MAG: hypothetical protein SWE60_18155 [Thermodesulfobacteriota bacterium]|nr:hypothetical protein [Thermodesulfobacteriota bacterium]